MTRTEMTDHSECRGHPELFRSIHVFGKLPNDRYTETVHTARVSLFRPQLDA
jgi:hypothetical protein